MMMSSTFEKPNLDDLRKIKPHEERALRRVYNQLSNRAARAKLEREIDRATSPEQEQELRAKLAEVNSQKTKISKHDLSEMLRSLGKPSPKRYILDMIWESDEDIEGSIAYEDIKLVFQRNISDRTGLEPSKLYNLVQFMIFDSNENGKVSVDETMAFLHARYGREGLEFKLKELFGKDMVESGTEGGEIDFVTYLEAVNQAQLRMYENSEQGQANSAKAGKQQSK
jgi:Ca2+-binding EF-hand superfamily protein